ncbi:LysR family transcriptional regulator [Arthrobacter globiformis]|uniref:LysR family transcriptional regulator n=1 Tax=Arthrobacter globiformis TaxID=1665 RepID=UPI00279171D1|nr:LysR family transcriptional regulator [Arthrobacter globiformis]MDQ0618427.1 DNA-binding transcriptional LysR family regulator [Arthrobacter globiformis]
MKTGVPLENYDLNLMRTFVRIYETRSVSRAAELLFISQPSVSYALGKLRRMLKDELFLRGPDGLNPTNVATAVYPQLRHSLEAIDEAVQGVTVFDPRTSRRNFRLLLTDIGEIALLPAVLTRIQDLAPAVSVEVLPLVYGTAREHLTQGKADAAICTPRIDSPDLVRDQLLVQSYWGICSASHPRIGAQPTVEEFLRERRVVVSEQLGHEHIQQRMRELNYDQAPAVRLPHFSAMPHVLGSTNYLGIVPEVVGQIFAAESPIKMFKLPFSVPPGNVALYTYRRPGPMPALDWLREIIRDALQEPSDEV